MAVQFAGDVALRIVDARLRTLVVNDRRAGPHRLFRIEHRRQQFVIDGELAAALFRRRLALRDHRGDALTDETDDAVEHGGIVRVGALVLVPRRRKQLLRRVFERQHRADAGDGERLIATYRRDPRVRVRRAQQLEMQQPRRRDIHGVARRSADDGACRRRRHVAAAGVAGLGLLDRLAAVQRLIDRAVAGAAADVALQRPIEVATLRLVQARGSHDHAGRAEAALKPLRLQEGLLHRMQLAVLGQAFDRGDGATLGAIGRETGTNAPGRRRPCTVQAPQSPASQPFLTPKQPSSRRNVRRHWPGRGRTVVAVPLTRKLTAAPRRCRQTRRKSRRRIAASLGGATPARHGCRRNNRPAEWPLRAARAARRARADAETTTRPAAASPPSPSA